MSLTSTDPSGVTTGSGHLAVVPAGKSGSSELDAVTEVVLREAGVTAGAVVVDLGCGTGSLSLRLATEGARVTAVDRSAAQVARLRASADFEVVTGITGVVGRIEDLSLPDESVDLVVSNHALHHLRDAEKAALLEKVVHWLRPGGRLVVGDLMFGRGATARDRAVIGSLVAALLRSGPDGWWRLARNVVRYGLRLGEHPMAMERWVRHLEGAGFWMVRALPVVPGMAVVTGVKRPARRR